VETTYGRPSGIANAIRLVLDSVRGVSTDRIVALWWDKGGKALLELVGEAQRRFAVVSDHEIGDNEGLVASDELSAASYIGLARHDAHPCPDLEAEILISTCLHSYSQVADLMRDALSTGVGDRDSMRKLSVLHDQIERDFARLSERIEELLSGR